MKGCSINNDKYRNIERDHYLYFCFVSHRLLKHTVKVLVDYFLIGLFFSFSFLFVFRLLGFAFANETSLSTADVLLNNEITWLKKVRVRDQI